MNVLGRETVRMQRRTRWVGMEDCGVRQEDGFVVSWLGIAAPEKRNLYLALYGEHPVSIFLISPYPW